MKNKMFIKASAMFLAVLMMLSVMSLGLSVSAAETVIFDEKYYDVAYEDRTLTVTLDAEEIGKLVSERAFGEVTLKDILPDDVYDLLKDHNRGAIVAFLSAMADKGLMTYEEILKLLAGNEEVMEEYFNYERLMDMFPRDVLFNDEVVDELLEEGYLDDIFDDEDVMNEIPGGDYATKEEAVEAVGGYVALVSILERLDKMDLLPSVKVLWSKSDVPALIDACSLTKLSKKVKSILSDLFFGEVSKAYLNGTEIYNKIDLVFDHNAIQKVVLQALPTAAELAAVKDGDVILDFVFKTTGYRITEDTFELKIVLKGDTTKINEYAEKVAEVFAYEVEDSGLIVVDFDFDERFTDKYEKFLGTDKISEENKLRCLSVFTKDLDALKDIVKGELFNQIIEKYKAADAPLNDKIDSNLAKIEKIRDLILRAAECTHGFTTIDDGYLGNGAFSFNISEILPLDTFKDKIEQSRFSSLSSVFEWLKQEDHVIDTKISVKVTDIYRVSFVDGNNDELFATYLPTGTDLTFLFGIEALDGHGDNGWYDIAGNKVTEMPDGDVVLKEMFETVTVTGVKVWEDDDNRDGVRPASIYVELYANGEYVDVVEVFGEDAAVGATASEIAENSNVWNFAFENLPAFDADGNAIRYTVAEGEDSSINGYTSTVEFTDGGWVITNLHLPEKISIAGTKVWNDPKTKDQKRPASITVVLYANGTEVDRIDVAGEGDVWAFEFTEQYKYENGEEIVYTIDEVDVEGYNKQINGYEIINSGLVELSIFALVSIFAIGGATVTFKKLKKRKDQE